MVELTLEELEALAGLDIAALAQKPKGAKAPALALVRTKAPPPAPVYISRVLMMNRVRCSCGTVFECPRHDAPLLRRKSQSRSGATVLEPDMGGHLELPLVVEYTDSTVAGCVRCRAVAAPSLPLPGFAPELGPHELATREFYDTLLGRRSRFTEAEEDPN